MESDEQITAQPVEWCAEAAEVLSNSRVHASVDDLREQVQSGAACLFRLALGPQLIGFYVLRVEGREGVLVAAAGNHPDLDLTASMVPLIEKQFSGCDSMRIHTARPGLIRKLAALGYQPREFVMGKAL